MGHTRARIYAALFLDSPTVCYNWAMRSCYNPETFKNAYPPTRFKSVPVMFAKKVIPASAGSSAEGQPLAPKVGAYTNSLVIYEADQTYYIYDSYGIPTKLPVSTETNTYTKGEINELISNAIGREALLRETEDESLDAKITDKTSALEDAIDNLTDNVAAIDTAIDRTVVTDVTLPSNPSTTSVQLNETKVNLKTSTSTTSSISIPVASTTQAGVMNKATFDAVTNNTANINAVLNGAIAVAGLASSPTQSDITTAWQTETGLTNLINRASVYDIDNNKVWTYYSNATTWYAASNTTQVTVSTFTNNSEGTIKGSTTAGQIFAENDGTGSVNGWDTLNTAVSNNTSKLSTIAQGAEVNVQSNWAEADSASDAYIQNKPTVPTITLSTTDIGEGAPLAANTLYGVYT